MTDSDPSCLFCRIVSGEIPADRVYEDDDVVGFRDVAPRAPTHVLVIPRRHVSDVHALADADAERLAGGYRIVTNSGPDSGQTVAHLHFHLLGGRPMSWPPG